MVKLKRTKCLDKMKNKRDRGNIIIENLNGKSIPKNKKPLTERELTKYDNKIDDFKRPEKEEDISDLIENSDSSSEESGESPTEILDESEIENERSDENFKEDEPKKYSYFTDNYEKFKKEYVKVVIDKLESSPDLLLKEDLELLFDQTHEKISIITEDELKDKVPLDEEWKLGLEPSEIKKYEGSLKSVRKYIADQEPSIPQIMALNIDMQEKSELVTEYDMYKNTEPYSIDYQGLRESLIKHIKKCSAPDYLTKKLDKVIKNLKDQVEIQVVDRIYKLNTSQENIANIIKVYEEYKIKADFDKHSREEDKLFKYYLELPYNNVKLFGPEKRKDILPFLRNVKESLDSSLYGLEDVKEQLLLYINNKITNPSSNKNNLALCGPPGVGKTALIKAVADALKLPFEIMTLGGMKDSSPLKGAFQLWEGSSPSLIIEALKRMKVSNGIILMDELDKINADEVENALIHLTDQTQNAKSEDLFLSEIYHNFSNIWFMFSMNNENRVNKILRDRLTIINIPKYTQKELFNIVKNHIIPKSAKEIFADTTPFQINDKVINILVDKIKNSVRDLERIVREILYKINLYINTGIYPKKGWISNLNGESKKKRKITPVIIDENNYEDFVDMNKYTVPENLSYFT